VGYFDGLTSSSFQDHAGRTPAVLSMGGARPRFMSLAPTKIICGLRQQVKGFTIVSLVSIIISGKWFVVSVAVARDFHDVLFRLDVVSLPRLNGSDERLSLQESMTSRVPLMVAVVLWLLEIVAFAAFGCRHLHVGIDPSQWLLALPVIVFFGLGAATFAPHARAPAANWGASNLSLGNSRQVAKTRRAPEG